MDLWALAVYDFGLTDAQFWKLTPLKFKALSRQHDRAVRHHDALVARVCWAAFSAAGAKKKNGEDLTPADLMPKYEDREDAAPAEQTPEQMLAAMRAAFPVGRTKRSKRPKPEAHGG